MLSTLSLDVLSYCIITFIFSLIFFFFLNYTATPEISPLSLPAALPIFCILPRPTQDGPVDGPRGDARSSPRRCLPHQPLGARGNARRVRRGRPAASRRLHVGVGEIGRAHV